MSAWLAGGRGARPAGGGVCALLALVVMVVLGAAPTAAQQPQPKITVAPSLIPGFNRQIPNYVVRCGAKPLQVTVSAPSGVEVSVDGSAPQSGSSTASVSVSNGQSFRFLVTTGSSTQTYMVRCLPPDFPLWTAKRLGQPQAAFYLVAPCCRHKYTIIYDNYGVPVWWLRGYALVLDASLLPSKDVDVGLNAGGRLGPGLSLATFNKYQLDGTFVRTFTIPGGVPTDRHELQVLPNGDYVAVAHVPRQGVNLRPYGGPANATVLDAFVAEVSPQGKLVWSWNSKNHISLSETTRPWYQWYLAHPGVLADGSHAYDLVHINAVAPYKNGFLVSLRQTDAIYSIDKATGKVRWKLGGTRTSKSLRIIGDNVPDFGGQHDVRALPDGTVTLHDNGTDYGRAPRALRFGINTKAHTSRLLERLVDHQTQPNSPCCGSVRKLPGGDWVIDWGQLTLTTELTPRGKPVFDLWFPNEYSYRAEPVLPGVLSRTMLDAAMDQRHPRTPQSGSGGVSPSG